MYIQTKLNFGGTGPQKIDSPNPSSTHEASPQKIGRGPESDTCFRCRKRGHWAKNCPEKSPIKPKQATPIISDSEFPHPLLCRCGFGPCLLRTSGTATNPGRKFYVCPGPTGKNCRHFRWCDEVTMAEINNPPQYTFPDCNCGAGTCHIDILKSGPNAGRECFVCSIPKGEGACSFSQLFDAQRDITVNGQAESKSFGSPLSTVEHRSSIDLVDNEDVRSACMKRRHFESPVTDNPQHSASPFAISEPSKRNKILLSEGRGHDEKSAISSPKLHDPLIDGSAANASSVRDSTGDLVISQENLCGSTIENTLKASLLTSQAGIHCRQIEFFRQISPAGATSFEGSVIPPHCPLLAEAEKLDTPLPSTGVLRDGAIEQSNLLKEKISERLRQTALSVQNDLLNSLESMDVLDHKCMLTVADSAFDALKSLGVDSTVFRERVMEFIDCMSLLAAIEGSMCDDLHSQALVDQYDQEKDHFDTLSCSHAEAMAAFTASNERRQSLHEEASSIKSKLVQIENQLSMCEAETMELENRLAEISEEVSMSQQSLQAAFRKAEEASKLREQREADRSTAKAALEKAKLQLRQ